MTVILVIALFYVSIGLILVLRNMRGFMVSATLGEWLLLILLWPLALHFYVVMSNLHNQTERLKEWAKREEQD